jgi:hypothetical protein
MPTTTLRHVVVVLVQGCGRSLLAGQGFAAVRAVWWERGQSYVEWVLVGDDRALGDGRASVGRIVLW